MLAEMNGKHLGEVEIGLINISIQNLDKIAESLGIPLLLLLDIRHEQTKDDLREEIDKIIDKATFNQMQLIYRIIRDIAS